VAHKLCVTKRNRRIASSEERQSHLKQLIAVGKEQGYFTYSQMNDYLLTEVVDPEQIEEIGNTLQDMGIPVYERTPESDALPAPETNASSDEEAIEEAGAALAALDAELGCTIETVRVFMRDGEAEIYFCRLIEEGLEAVRNQVSLYLPTYDYLFRAYAPVKAGTARLADVIVGFIDPNAPDVTAQPQNPTKVEAVAPAEAARRFASLQKLHGQLGAAIAKVGLLDPKAQKLRKQLAGEFMQLKLAPRMFDALIDNLRG
jgi:RNA polymerase primary sigma factor